MELSTYIYKQTLEFCDTQYWRKFETSLNPSCLQYATFCVIFKINIIVENGWQKEQKILEFVITVRSIEYVDMSSTKLRTWMKKYHRIFSHTILHHHHPHHHHNLTLLSHRHHHHFIIIILIVCHLLSYRHTVIITIHLTLILLRHLIYHLHHLHQNLTPLSNNIIIIVWHLCTSTDIFVTLWHLL